MKTRKNVWKSFPVCLAVSVLLTVLPCFFTDIFYLYGDDYLLNYIANGSFGEKYSAIVKVRRTAYQLIPGAMAYSALSISPAGYLMKTRYALYFSPKDPFAM